MKNNRVSSVVRGKLFKRGLLAIFLLVCVAVLLGVTGSRVSSQSSQPPQPPQARNDEVKPVAQLVADAKRAGRDFQLAEVFNRQTRSAAADVARRRAVKAGTVLQLRRDALADLVTKNAPSLTLRLPTFGGPPVELELVQVNLFAPGFKVVTSDSNGAAVNYEQGVHYWGTIKDVEGSLAAISIFKDEVIGTYSSPSNGNFVLGKLAGNNPGRCDQHYFPRTHPHLPHVFLLHQFKLNPRREKSRPYTPSFLCRLEDVVVYWKVMRFSGFTTLAAACAISAASWKPERMSFSFPG